MSGKVADLAASSALETSKKLQEENLELRAQIEELGLAADEAAQYSRRNCLIISGIPELKKDDTEKTVINIAGKWLDIQLDIGKIDRMHRLKVKESQGMPCPIIQSVSWILAEFCYNRSPQGPYTGTCTILQEKINGFLCPLFVFRKM